MRFLENPICKHCFLKKSHSHCTGVRMWAYLWGDHPSPHNCLSQGRKGLAVPEDICLLANAVSVPPALCREGPQPGQGFVQLVCSTGAQAQPRTTQPPTTVHPGHTPRPPRPRAALAVVGGGAWCWPVALTVQSSPQGLVQKGLQGRREGGTWPEVAVPSHPRLGTSPALLATSVSGTRWGAGGKPLQRKPLSQGLRGRRGVVEEGLSWGRGAAGAKA